MLKKIFILLLCFVFATTGLYAATTTPKAKSPYKTKMIEVTTKDAHIIKAKLMYKKVSDKSTKFPVVVLLHSLGYSSSHWGNLPGELLKQNYAVLMVDLRGHGNSTKDAKFKTSYWSYYSNKTFQKYPSDVIAVINQTKQSVKKVTFNKYAIIGGDIGANTAVLVAQKISPKPSSLVLLSPSIETKGLKIASLNTASPIGSIGNCPILVMCSSFDKQSIQQEELLQKFVKSPYFINNLNITKSGMMLVRNNPSAISEILGLFKATLK